jgi:hypothetical protein
MTIRIDQFGNLRAPDPSGQSAVKRSETARSKARRVARIRKDRRARVLLVRTVTS